MKKKILYLMLIVLLGEGQLVFADTNTGANFLKISVGARAVGMGSAYTAVADDATAIYWNPAGLSRLFKRELSLMHSEWLLGTKYDFMGYAHPVPWGTVGLGITRLSVGELEGRSSDREAMGRFSAAGTAYIIGFSMPLSCQSGIGVNIKYLTSKLGSDSASTFSLDLGAIHKLKDKPISLGISLQNIGPGMKFLSQRDTLPLSLVVGGAYQISGAFGMVLDLKYEPYDRKVSVGIGTEYTALSILSLRAGYASYVAQSVGEQRIGSSSLSGLGGGFGLKMGNYTADYVFMPFSDLGNVQNISLGARF
ncbi:MAG: PorV/PorQ family protein [Elusimicrobia bacterium]|nr:PorV/PorQ family protein [Elusimicrobiota bacterium]